MSDKYEQAIAAMRAEVESGKNGTWQGDFDAPNDVALKSALPFVHECRAAGLTIGAIHSSADGGFTLAFYAEHGYADIECCNNGTLLGCTYAGNPRSFDIFHPDELGSVESIAKIKAFIEGRTA